MKLCKTLWLDECGMMGTAELILLSTIVLIGTIVGLTTMRDQVVQEFGDMGLAVGELNQSYSYNQVQIDLGGGQIVTVAGSTYVDNSDFCEGPDPVGQPPACISVTIPAAEEGN